MMRVSGTGIQLKGAPEFGLGRGKIPIVEELAVRQDGMRG
jgi:hypothetical protein